MVENNNFDAPKRGNMRIAIGILALIFGGFGVHKFVLGYFKEGLLMFGSTMLFLSTAMFGFGIIFIWAGIIAIIEGLKYLFFMSNEKFYNTYQKNRRGWL